MISGQQAFFEDIEEQGGAHLSDDGLYRLALWRRWGVGRMRGYVMLNPSVADARLDDHTIRRCRSLARRDGFDGIFVVNLYAYRTSDPRELWQAADPIGPDNDHALVAAARNPRIGELVVAWGALPAPAVTRADQVLHRLRSEGRALVCHGVTLRGFPRHPSRLPDSAPVRLLP